MKDGKRDREKERKWERERGGKKEKERKISKWKKRLKIITWIKIDYVAILSSIYLLSIYLSITQSL